MQEHRTKRSRARESSDRTMPNSTICNNSNECDNNKMLDASNNRSKVVVLIVMPWACTSMLHFLNYCHSIDNVQYNMCNFTARHIIWKSVFVRFGSVSVSLFFLLLIFLLCFVGLLVCFISIRFSRFVHSFELTRCRDDNGSNVIYSLTNSIHIRSQSTICWFESE